MNENQQIYRNICTWSKQQLKLLKSEKKKSSESLFLCDTVTQVFIQTEKWHLML